LRGKANGRVAVLLVALSGVLVLTGCGKPREKSAQPVAGSGEVKVVEIEKAAAREKKPYQGNLTPEKAAEITNAVAKLSFAEIPSQELPKDPKVMLEINERIRKKIEGLYAQYGTSMKEVTNYVSDLSPKERELYNKKLTDLFLEEAGKKYGAEPKSKRKTTKE